MTDVAIPVNDEEGAQLLRISAQSTGGIAPGDEVDDTLIEVQHRLLAGHDDDDVLDLALFFLQTRGKKPWDL